MAPEQTEERQRARGVLTELPTDALVAEIRNLAGALGERAASSVSDKVESATGRLTEYAKNGGGTPLLGAGLSGIAGKVKSAIAGKLSGGGGDTSGPDKVTNIVESIDVGVPVDVAYDQWTRFEEFPEITKKVESVSQESDEVVNWQAKVFWSRRSWRSTIVDQVPDQRIVWRSEGDKGRVDGAVTFHELTPDLTRVLLVLEYYPKGLFEHVGNLWRAQGRRARLELKHFQRHVMSETALHPDDVKGWRGEIHDGQVVDGSGGEEGGEEEEEDE
ncbi:MAG: SRPBCC family protein [Mycobacteriales bacterium]